MQISRFKKAGYVVAAFLGTMFVGLPAWATPPDPVDVVGDGAESLQDTLISIGVRVLPYAAAVLALTIGWRFAKRFVRGS